MKALRRNSDPNEPFSRAKLTAVLGMFTPLLFKALETRCGFELTEEHQEWIMYALVFGCMYFIRRAVWTAPGQKT